MPRSPINYLNRMNYCRYNNVHVKKKDFLSIIIFILKHNTMRRPLNELSDLDDKLV